MKVVIKASNEVIAAADSLFSEHHGCYYAQNLRCIRSAEVAALFGNKTEEVRCGYNNTAAGSGWVTCGGNAVLLSKKAGTVTYVGVRHGIAPLLEALAISRTADLEAQEIVSYETTMPFLRPCETLQHFFERASLRSNCQIERGIALMKSGKSISFMCAEGLPVVKIVELYKTCEGLGYCWGLK